MPTAQSSKARVESAIAGATARVTCRPTEAHEVFGISRATLYRWADAGHIRIHKCHGVSLVVVQDVLEYIRSQGG